LYHHVPALAVANKETVLDDVHRFWHQRGLVVSLPVYKHLELDMFRLLRQVALLGGYWSCTAAQVRAPTLQIKGVPLSFCVLSALQPAWGLKLASIAIGMTRMCGRSSCSPVVQLQGYDVQFSTSGYVEASASVLCLVTAVKLVGHCSIPDQGVR
jgi:hypothetical protein